MSLVRSVLLIVGLSSLGLGCEQAVECGLGTTEVDGVCQLMDGPEDLPRCCGPGTHLDGNLLRCVPDYAPRICDVLTTMEEPNDDGVLVCVGFGTTGCEPPCPLPDSGKLTVCGTLLDAETSQVIAVPDAEGDECEDASQGGPCALAIEFYDALEFAQNPQAAVPLPYDEFTVNECGNFAVRNIPVPALGFLGVGVDDAEGASDDYVLSGVAVPAVPGQRIEDLSTYAVRQTTDQSWTSTAGSPFGATFNERGAVLAIYLDCNGNPVSGVGITVNGSPQSADDYYFSDTDPMLRTTVDADLTATGANGSALIVDSPLVDHGGTDNAPPGCDWEDALAKSIPGVTFVTERHPEDSGGGTCCQ